MADLIRLTDVKTWLGLDNSNSDALLRLLIGQVSAGIQNYTSRQSFVPTDYTELLRTGMTNKVQLRQWPVISVSSVSVNGQSIPASSGYNNAGWYLSDMDVGSSDQMHSLIFRNMYFMSGGEVEISYRAGYQMEETVTVPAVSPYTVTATEYWMTSEAVLNSGGAAMVKVATSPASGQFSVVDGVYTFNAAQSGQTVTLRYGYLPRDLAQCAMHWVSEIYKYRERIGYSSKSLGGQETVSFIVKDMPDLVTLALNPYRRVFA